jgi:FdhD protein
MEMEDRDVMRVHLGQMPKTSIIKDKVALDEPTCIFINGEYHVTLIATPNMKKELAAGYLKSEGVIKTMDEIKSINLIENDVHIELKGEVDLRDAAVMMMNLIVTACGASQRTRKKPSELPRIISEVEIEAETVLKMLAELNKRSKIHLETGGTHAAMIYSDDGQILAFAEDVGRHNAVDKVIGSMVMKGADMKNRILTSTGRQSAEMVQKAARSGIPIIASMTSPLISGIRMAEMTGITLICFARGKRMQVYTNHQRLSVNSD